MRNMLRASNIISFRHVGYDGFNKALTGDTSMTVTAKRSDPHHVPCVISIAHDRAANNFARQRIAFPKNGVHLP